MVCLTVFIITDSFACSMSDNIEDYRDTSLVYFIGTPTGHGIDGSQNTFDYFFSDSKFPVTDSVKRYYYSSEYKVTGYVVDINYVSEEIPTQIRQTLNKKPHKAVLVIWNYLEDCTGVPIGGDPSRIVVEQAFILGTLRDKVYWIDNLPTIDIRNPYLSPYLIGPNFERQHEYYIFRPEILEAYKRFNIRHVASAKEFLDFYELFPFNDDDEENKSKAKQKLKDWVKINPEMLMAYPFTETILRLEILEKSEQQRLKNIIDEALYVEAEGWVLDPSRECYIWSSNFGFEYLTNVSWSGDCVNGMASGEGKLTLEFEDKAANLSEEGIFKEGKLDGKGIYVSSDGDKYEGAWKAGYEHGYGEYIYSKGYRYEGEWKEGLWHGQGTYIDVAGNRYEGEWLKGRNYIDKQGNHFEVNKNYKSETVQITPMN